MEKIKCKICRCADYTVVYGSYPLKEGPIDIVKCNSCGQVYNNPQLDREEILSYYDEEYYGICNMRFIGLIEKFVHFKRKIRAQRIRKYVKSGKVLDIGCGRGIFLNEMRKRGYEVYGTEISETGAKFAKQVLKLDIFIGQIKSLKFPDNYFDIVTIYHVIEHLSDPLETINEIKRILKPGGLLLIAVPNIESLQARIFKTYWFHLDIPRHYFHFSRKSLGRILPPEEWDILKEKNFSFEQGPFGWVQSAANLIFGRDNILYNILKEKTSGNLKNYVTRKFKVFRWTITSLNLILGGLLILPATVLSLIVGLTDYNEIIEIYYRKK